MHYFILFQKIYNELKTLCVHFITWHISIIHVQTHALTFQSPILENSPHHSSKVLCTEAKPSHTCTGLCILSCSHISAVADMPQLPLRGWSNICGAPRQTGAKVPFSRFWDINTIAEIIKLPSFWDIYEGSRVSTFWDIERNVNKTRWQPFFEKLRNGPFKFELRCVWILLTNHYRMTMKFAEVMV